MKCVKSETGDVFFAAGGLIRELPPNLRPREELERRGVENLSDAGLLAILLRHGTKGMGVVQLANRLLQIYGSLTAISRTTVDELSAQPGVGRVKAQILKAAFELAHRLLEENATEQPQIRRPHDVARLLRPRAVMRETEAFWVLLLDTRNRLIRPPIEITRGILDASLIHPREVFRDAIRSSSSALVLAHNHPSGDPTPSQEDIRITKQLVDAGRILEIYVLDHVIVGRRESRDELPYVSLREMGVVEFYDRD